LSEPTAAKTLLADPLSRGPSKTRRTFKEFRGAAAGKNGKPAGANEQDIALLQTHILRGCAFSQIGGLHNRVGGQALQPTPAGKIDQDATSDEAAELVDAAVICALAAHGPRGKAVVELIAVPNMGKRIDMGSRVREKRDIIIGIFEVAGAIAALLMIATVGSHQMNGRVPALPDRGGLCRQRE
jgi:hypothetical protein